MAENSGCTDACKRTKILFYKSLDFSFLKINVNVEKDKTMYFLSNQRGCRSYETRKFYMEN